MAVVVAKEYFENLFRIQDENPPSLALLLPSSKRTYHIDLETRKVESPEFLSVEREHKAEVLYFTVNRYFDYIDLSETVCIIKYVNANKKSHYYAVPFYDVVTPNQSSWDEGKDDKSTDLMLIPWVLDGQVAEAAGEVKFSFEFYKMDADGLGIIYSLNTLPATGTILHGMEEDSGFKPSDYEFTASQYEQLMSAINENRTQWLAGLQWLKAE